VDIWGFVGFYEMLAIPEPCLTSPSSRPDHGAVSQVRKSFTRLRQLIIGEESVTPKVHLVTHLTVFVPKLFF
jgi:hypothetical protein